jgi:hypothetical protein
MDFGMRETGGKGIDFGIGVAFDDRFLAIG